jgi:predicted permease
MPDWKRIVRERLRLPDLRELRGERIVEEIAGQLEDLYQQERTRGVTEAEAEGRALDHFDWEVLAEGLETAERPNRRPHGERWADGVEEGMRRRGGSWVPSADFLQDLRLAVRQLRRRPGVTVAAVFSLAIAISGGAYLYGTAVETLLKPSTAADPARVVRLYTAWEGSLPYGSISYSDFEDLRDGVEAFESAVVTAMMPMYLNVGERTQRIWGGLVSGGYFQTLGVGMALGRAFLPEEDLTEGTHPVAVISYAFWQNRFGGDPEVIGRKVEINRHPFTIVGVAEKGFYGDSVGLVMPLWVPAAMHEVATPLLTGFHIRDNHSLRSIIARLKPEATLAQAEEQVAAVRERLAGTWPDLFVGKTYRVYPEREASLDPLVRRDFARFITFGFVMVALVLLLASSNVAGLLLARTAGRTRELGIRMALGAGRGRLVRTLLAESLVLGGLGGLAGLVLSMVMNRASAGLSVPIDVPLSISTGKTLNPSDFYFMLAATVVVTLLIGLTPAIQALREDVVASLKSGDGRRPHRAHLARRALVAVQVAVSFALLAGGGMVLKGLRHMQQIDPGFDPDGQLVAGLDLTLQRYSEEEGRRFFTDLKERLLGLPGVEAVGLAFSIPLSLMMQTHGVEPEGYEVPEGERLLVDVNTVDEDYFTAMGIPILEGRAFTRFDDPAAPPVVIVNEAFRDRFWPGASPIGRRIKHGETWYEVVGMVPTGKYLGLGEEPRPYYYYAFAQDYIGMVNLHIRTSGNPLALAPAVRREVAELDPSLPVGELNTMRGRTAFALMPYTIATGAMWVFGLLSILLASIGLYGLVAYFVNRQRREIGIRMALGARERDVLWHVVGRGLRITLIGLAIGLVFALGTSVMVSGLIRGLHPIEPLVLGIPMLLLTAIALAASWFPARQAVRISPVEVMRSE